MSSLHQIQKSLATSTIILILIVHLYARLSRGINRSSVCLVGKTAIITGANSGLGYQTALNLASRGCRVIMADVDDMEESRLNIIKYTNNNNIVSKKLDLSSLKSVRSFAADIKKTEKSFDILINNAGIGAHAGNKTDDGLDPLMHINCFGHFLLTHLLIDLLKTSAPSRIVFTSSAIAFANRLSLKTLNGVSGYHIFKGYHLYGNSKVAMIIASDILAEKLKGTGVTSNCVHPGFVRTPGVSKCYSITKNIFYIIVAEFCIFFFSKDPWEGSQVLVHVAVSKKLEKVTGCLFSDCKLMSKPSSLYDKKWCREIWEASEKYVKLEQHERI